MKESMTEASGTMQAPRVIGIEIRTILFARDRPDAIFSSAAAGIGLMNRQRMIIYSMATHSAREVPSSAPALPSIQPPREKPTAAKGRATATLPTCSISWLIAVGSILRMPCIYPR